MPVDVSFATVKGGRTVLEKFVNLASAYVTISFSTTDQVTNMTFDPHGWLLANFAVTNVTLVTYQSPFYEEGLFWISVAAIIAFAVAVLVVVRRRKKREKALPPS